MSDRAAITEVTTEPGLVTEPPVPGGQEKPRSLGRDAWEDLRRNPIFIVSMVLIIILLLIAIFPSWFTNKSPYDCHLEFGRQGPSGDAWFGYDIQGCDVYSRTIYGARASISVGFLATIGTMLLGSLLGVIAGFFGGLLDTLVSRLTDIFFGIPLLLGAIVLLSSFPSSVDTPQIVTILKVVLALLILGWTAITRLMRSSVIQVKQADYVQAARALGASNSRIMRNHIIPNGMAPVIVYATIALGVYISVEATLSFLGIGLQPPVVSWGVAISDAQRYIRTAPHMLLFPGAFLSVTVFAFIMLGDAVRDALDPKLR